jgi:hypothetical protein
MGSGRGSLIGPLRIKIVVALKLNLLHHLTPTQQWVGNKVSTWFITNIKEFCTVHEQ